MPEAGPPVRPVRGDRSRPGPSPRGGVASGAGPEPEPDPGAGSRAGLELGALGTGLTLTCVLLARLGSWAGALGTFQSLYAVAFAFFALALARSRRGRVARPALLVFAVAAATRLALLPVTPTLSDDVYRYVWEGKVAAAGGDPYRSSPLDPALAPLRDREIHPRINHPGLATIYPPLAIAGFAAVARLSPTVWAMKSWVVLHDLALVLLLLAWTRRRGLSPLAVIAYAWNPLVLVEYAGSGHHDPTAIVWLIASLVLAERRPLLSALALAAGALVKLAPIVALPYLVRRWRLRARVAALLALAAGLGAYWGATRGPDSGLAAYGRAWSNNELLFAYLARVITDPLAARVAALGLLVAVLGLLLRRRGETGSAVRAATRAAFLLSPVAHPWYLGWVLAFEPLAPSAPWLLLSLTAILSYGVFATPGEGGAFHLSLGWRWVEYGLPLLLALALAGWRRARAAGAPDA